MTTGAVSLGLTDEAATGEAQVIEVAEEAAAGEEALPALEPLAEVEEAPALEALEPAAAEADLGQLVEAPPEGPEATFTPSDDEVSLEEIIRRAEAQEALFPQAFGHPDKKDE